MNLLLAIESSCDETAVALFDIDGSAPPRLLMEEVASQIDLHRAYGGVVPELAAREHSRLLPILVDKVLNDAQQSLRSVRCVGVTAGPGLKGSLLVGVNFAAGLGLALDVPVLPINHIEGHLLAAMLDHPDLTFPYLVLVVSGGHTELLWVENLGKYRCLARTIDDAAGEAFDKSAKLLGLGYPGGPSLAALADEVTTSAFTLPKVAREIAGFSFSGLKTAVSLLIRANTSPAARPELAYAIQQAIVESLLYKCELAIDSTGAQRIVVSGGVAANKALRAEMQKLTAKKRNTKVFFPTFAHCTDNAAMIGYVAALRYRAGCNAPAEWEVFPRWPVEDTQLLYQQNAL